MGTCRQLACLVLAVNMRGRVAAVAVVAFPAVAAVAVPAVVVAASFVF